MRADPHCLVCGELASTGRPESGSVADCPRCHGTIEKREWLEPLIGQGARGNAIAEYWTGLRFGLRGVQLMLSNRRVLSLVVIPALINIALFAALVYLLLTHLGSWLPSFEKPFITGLDWLRPAVRFVVLGLADLIAILAAALSMLTISTVINAPFHEWISEAVESLVLGRHDERPYTPARIWRVLIYPVIQAGFLALFQAVIAVVLFAISFSGVLAPVSTIGGVWLLAVSLVDIVIARKSYAVSDRFAVVAAAAPAWFGLATPLIFAPFLIAFFVPGATLLYLRGLRSTFLARR